LTFVAARGLSFLPSSFVGFKIPRSNMLARNNAGRGTARCVASNSPRELAWALILIGGLGFAAQGCHSQKSNAGPTSEFIKVPSGRTGRPREDRHDRRARQNAHPGQQIVIYAHSGTRWVQPWPDRALTSIRADSTWSTETHWGFEYAVLLVDPEYHPLPTLDAAPTQGGLVALVRIVKGTGTPQFAPTRSPKFSGYDRVPLLESWQMEGLGL
jgi:hypothetical protein